MFVQKSCFLLTINFGEYFATSFLKAGNILGVPMQSSWQSSESLNYINVIILGAIEAKNNIQNKI